jgi:hypothetical protein
MDGVHKARNTPCLPAAAPDPNRNSYGGNAVAAVRSACTNGQAGQAARRPRLAGRFWAGQEADKVAWVTGVKQA